MTNEPIDSTPFRMIGNDEQGWAIAVGKYRITEIAKTREEAEKQITEMNDWNTIANLISCMIQIHVDLENEMNATPFATKTGRTM